MINENTSNPIDHVNQMQERFKQCIDHLRSDIDKINEAQCKAMFETSAEVLTGLIKAFEDYKNKNEKAWK